VRDGVGPDLGIYLKSSQNWNPAEICMAAAASSIVTVMAQTPAGELIDRLRQKRMSIVVAAVVVSIDCMAIAMLPAFPTIIACQVLIGGAAAVFPPAIASLFSSFCANLGWSRGRYFRGCVHPDGC